MKQKVCACICVFLVTRKKNVFEEIVDTKYQKAKLSSTTFFVL